MSGGERVDRSLQKITAGVAVEVAVGLSKRDELGCAAKGIEDERAVLFGEAEIFGDLGGKRGAVGFLLEELRIDGGRLRVVGVVGVV